MSTYLTEEEQIVAMKRWWAENGRTLIIGVLLAVVGFLGWKYWQAQQAQAEINAASLYEEFTQVIVKAEAGELSEEDSALAQELASELKNSHANSLYASNAAMFQARLAAEKPDIEAAEFELHWVLDNSPTEAIGFVAKQRLAQIAYAKEDYTQALDLLSDVPAGFESTFAELKGDVYMAQDKFPEAVVAYENSLETLLPTQAGRRSIVEMKLQASSARISEVGGDQAAEVEG